MRKKLLFPKGLNKSLSMFYEEVTHSFEDIVDKIALKTTFKQKGTNFTNIIFTSNPDLKQGHFLLQINDN